MINVGQEASSSLTLLPVGRHGFRPVKSIASTAFLADHDSMVAACCSQLGSLSYFSALMMLIEQQEGHPASKNVLP